MKYKLIKPLPWHPVGTEFETDGAGLIWIKQQLWITPEAHPDFFEPIDSRWRPKMGQGYWYFDAALREVHETTWHMDGVQESCLWNGNCFKNRAQAEQAMELVKETLRKFNEGL